MPLDRTADTAPQPDTGRRLVLSAGLGLGTAAMFAPLAAVTSLGGCATTGAGRSAVRSPTLGFQSVPVSTADRVVVPPGYTATPLAPWGEPVGMTGAMPAWRPDASNSAADQAVQMGMHHDGMQFYALDGSSRRGLLVINHEYVDDGLLHPTGLNAWSADKVAKSQAAHGISVIEVALQDQRWQMVRPSRYARRITAQTPCTLSGPAAGHALLKTAADASGRRVLGTVANCGAGRTPWGTYLAGEENFQDYFATSDQPTAHEKRYALSRGVWYRWHEHDPRFDTVRHPNEPNRFGWIVEVDPLDPASTPVKRTALGRGMHEGAWVAVTRDGRAVVYSGEDAVFETITKFVSRDKIAPAGNGLTAAQANAQLLDNGTLYVARFDADGTGRWLPLVHADTRGQGPLTAANGFADQGEVLVKARQAGDALGATRMDRPEWMAVDQGSGWVFCSLTNNGQRGAPGKAGVDAANPRAENTMGQIIRWRDTGDFDGLTFQWNHLLLAGDPANARAEARGNIQRDIRDNSIFANPDTLAIDARGVLWIGTDVSASRMHQGEMARLGNNQLLACNPASGAVRRFLTGPAGCELTGVCWAPDGRTLFVNVQHPGETPQERNDAAFPRKVSNWPDFRPDGRPRSATLAVRRDDGGVIGA